MIGFVLSETFRDVRRAGRVGVSAVVMIGFSLVALGGFWVLSANLGPRRRSARSHQWCGGLRG